jgi:hypothetical protein
MESGMLRATRAMRAAKNKKKQELGWFFCASSKHSRAGLINSLA